MAANDSAPHGDDWQFDVTPGEICRARRDWLAARDGEGPVADSEIDLLFEYYRFLISLQAQQIADDFRNPRNAA